METHRTVRNTLWIASVFFSIPKPLASAPRIGWPPAPGQLARNLRRVARHSWQQQLAPSRYRRAMHWYCAPIGRAERNNLSKLIHRRETEGVKRM